MSEFDPLDKFWDTLDEPPTFETRIVAFLDVLGWRSLITRAESDERARKLVYKAVTDVQETISTRLGEMLSDGLTTRQALRAEVSQFSDSIVLSADLAAGPDIVFGFFLELLAIVRGYLHYDLLVRGGVAVGPMYHSGSVAFGPALTQAYDIESTVALNPRVVLAADWQELGERYPAIADEKIAHYHLLRLDDDGKLFLDYLYPLVPPLWSSTPTPHTPETLLRLAGDLVRRSAHAYAGQSMVLKKYQWLARYHDAVLGEIQSKGLKPVSPDLFGPGTP